jgi:two-component system sensor histidine kinase KdpD
VLKTQDLITLIVFLVIAVVTSQLIGQAREGMRLAKSHEWEATRMYELISAIAGLEDNQSIARMLAQRTLETFHCDRVEVFIQSLSNIPPISMLIAEGAARESQPVIRMPMMTARGLEGEIRLWREPDQLTQEEDRLLSAFASQGALSVERTRLFKGKTRASILEETDRFKSMLLSSVSHELRSPLAVIKASVSSLRSGMVDWDSDARQELLETIEEESDHLNLLVGNLLDMTRIEAGALKPQRRWNSLAEIASTVVKRMRGTLREYQVSMEIPADFPLVPTDYVLIEQVFSNLLNNSIKFAPAHTQITIRADKEQDSAHVQVSNQGPPVPQANLERIFDKFNRLNPADRITGTGLGLSICKGIIEAHEGKIWAENTPGCLVFHFTLPLKLNGAAPEMPVEVKDE